jgi:ABC-type taurine transport system ATPase subunit
VLRDVSLAVNPGEVVVVIGLSGWSKTALRSPSGGCWSYSPLSAPVKNSSSKEGVGRSSLGGKNSTPGPC